jgi:hypothetical protein
MHAEFILPPLAGPGAAAGCGDEAAVTSSIDAAPTKTAASIGDARSRCAATMAGCVEIDVGCGEFVRRAVGMRERRVKAEVAYECALRRVYIYSCGARPSRSDGRSWTGPVGVHASGIGCSHSSGRVQKDRVIDARLRWMDASVQRKIEVE